MVRVMALTANLVTIDCADPRALAAVRSAALDHSVVPGASAASSSTIPGYGWSVLADPEGCGL
jgi:hypothetical protein